MGHWRCKQHKEGCRSYVQSIVENLESGKKEPLLFLSMVEYVDDEGNVMPGEKTTGFWEISDDENLNRLATKINDGKAGREKMAKRH